MKLERERRGHGFTPTASKEDTVTDSVVDGTISLRISPKVDMLFMFRSPQMKKYRAEDNDPFRDVKDWQDHRYDPGYFTGGNIHPLLKARRPNKYGYVLISGGLGFLFVAFFGPFSWIDFLIQIAMALLLIAAGVKLVKGTEPSAS